MTKHAVVLIAHTEEGVDRDAGDIIRNMAQNQFDDFEAVGLVRAATSEDLAATDAPAPAASGAKAAKASA